jgi:hypothetical protein
MSKHKLTLAFGVAALAMLGVGSSSGVARSEDRSDNDDQQKVERGFALAPVPLHFKKKNRELVGLGSYIVNAQGGCNDCHTNPPFAPGGDPHLGQPKKVNAPHYLAGGMAFGPFVSRNITPDPEKGDKPAGLTFDQFLHVLRTGEDLDKDPPHVPSFDHDLLQVMPWPVYGGMTDRDLQAIYAYLSAIPHADPGP